MTPVTASRSSEPKSPRERKGSFWADFLNFQRRTETTGWRFTALVLLVNDLVVYRSWSGQPAIDEKEVTHNPLGPFQDIGPSVVPNAVPIVAAVAPPTGIEPISSA